MEHTSDQDIVLGHIENAGRLYENYLQVAQVASCIAPEDIRETLGIAETFGPVGLVLNPA